MQLTLGLVVFGPYNRNMISARVRSWSKCFLARAFPKFNVLANANKEISICSNLVCALKLGKEVLNSLSIC